MYNRGNYNIRTSMPEAPRGLLLPRGPSLGGPRKTSYTNKEGDNKNMAKRKHIEYQTSATPRAVTKDGLSVFCAYDEIVTLQATKPNPRNPNTHGQDQIRLLGAIIQATGWRAAITISKRSGLIVKGHGRRLAALHQGLTEVPVEYQEYASEAEEQADLIADNRLAELAQIDDKQLLDLLVELDSEIPTELAGFNADDIEALLMAMNGTTAPDEDDIDDIPELQQTYISKPGDIWNLGPHRLLCGSATDAAAVARLMQDEKAQMVHTDPPYGVSYKSQSGKFDMLENDDLTGDALLRELLQPAFELYHKYTDPDAAFYVWHASSTRREFEDALKAVGLLEKQYIIWAKPIPVLGHADYQWAHEPCFYMGKAGESTTFYGDRTQKTMWKATIKTADGLATTLTGGVVLQDGEGHSVYLDGKLPKSKKLRYIRLAAGKAITLYQEDGSGDLWEVSRDRGAIHPTQKPVELPVRAIENSSQAGDLVLDFFAGSGSTLIGAELVGRRCYAIEFDPQYCDAIIRRYMKLMEKDVITGKDAKGKDLIFESEDDDELLG